MQRNIYCLALPWYQFDTSITQTNEYIKHFVMQGSKCATSEGLPWKPYNYLQTKFIKNWIHSRFGLGKPFQICWYL